MNDKATSAFEQIPANPRGHFVLYYYAAVFRFITHIIRLSQLSATEVDELFRQYPFLRQYYMEIQRYLPDNRQGQAGIDWWMEELARWETACPVSLPLKSLIDDAGLSVDACIAFMLIGLVEEDSRFGNLFADMQAPLGQRRPTLEFVGQTVVLGRLMSAMDDPWTICRPLVDVGLVDIINDQKPRSEWVVRVPSLLWDVARGEVREQLAPWCRYYKTPSNKPIDELIYQHDVVARLENIPRLIQNKIIHSLVIRSDYGSDSVEVFGALARQAGLDLIVADADTPEHVASMGKILGPVCTMIRAMPVIRYNISPGETIRPVELCGFNGTRGFMTGFEGGIETSQAAKTLTLSLPPADAALRERYWRQCLNGADISDLSAIVNRFHVSGAYIRKLAAIADTQASLDGRDQICLDDVRHASRTLNRQQLDTLADRLESCGNWQDMVANDTTASRLQELERRCIHREALGKKMRGSAGLDEARGVRALFTGASGTGKTLAAKKLASELGMDIYRVDLAAVINKFIGETEKNLHQVLSMAESLDVILLLDEGDALLGSRTDVKSANDRYANLETNYLLQRLENYQGIVLVTTNLVENIDHAFQRRMDIVVPFFVPQQQQRLQILELHLPLDHQVGYECLQQVAGRCALTGAQIRNVVLHASLLALEDDCALNEFHLTEALRSEYRKAGAMFPLADNIRENWSKDAGMASFVTALANH